jgi:hypothetical protein
MLLASCGGGGPGGVAAQSSPAVTQGGAQTAAAITGYVVEGPVAGASVNLYQVDTSGNKTLLGSAVTDAAGYFSIPNAAPANAAILIEAKGGSYIDEMTRQTVALTTPMRAAAVSNGGAARISITPYSEAAVRMVEHLPAPDWSSARIASANQRVAAVLGVTELLDFIPVDLQGPQPQGAIRDNDFTLSVFTSGFSGYARRLDPHPATSLDTPLDGLRRMFTGEEHDDLVMPAFVGGIVDFVDVSSGAEVARQALKTSLLTAAHSGPVSPLTDEQLRKYRPTGVSSGGVTALMPADAFQLVGTTARGSLFNYRGALVGYPLENTNGLWRMPYTASVAEVFGDGDVGIGRWNGGTTLDATRSGAQLIATTTAQPLMFGSWHYALARPVSAVPSCGNRRLALVANTLPTVMSDSAGATAVAKGLTADSSVTFQYAGKILAGFDIGVVGPDGSVTRFTSQGGLAAPWASLVQIDPQAASEASTVLQSGGTGSAGSWALGLKGLASGSGAAKFVARLSLGPAFAPTEFAAAFVAPAGVDTSGCASASGDPGAAIDPPPANGSYFVFSGINDVVTYRGAPVDTAFRTRGELATASPLQVGSNTPIYELAGNADASIGRIDGDFTLAGAAYHRSMPYAVAREGAVIPATGTRHYALVASTLVAAEVTPSSTAGLVLGKVQSASLDINFGEYPVGTSSPYYGTASLRVTGSAAGIPFSIASVSDNSLPSDSIFARDGARFGDFTYSGALAAPRGDYATVRFQATAGPVPVTGTLLFRAQ